MVRAVQSVESALPVRIRKLVQDHGGLVKMGVSFG